MGWSQVKHLNVVWMYNIYIVILVDGLQFLELTYGGFWSILGIDAYLHKFYSATKNRPKCPVVMRKDSSSSEL